MILFFKETLLSQVTLNECMNVSFNVVCEHRYRWINGIKPSAYGSQTPFIIRLFKQKDHCFIKPGHSTHLLQEAGFTYILHSPMCIARWQ